MKKSYSLFAHTLFFFTLLFLSQSALGQKPQLSFLTQNLWKQSQNKPSKLELDFELKNNPAIQWKEIWWILSDREAKLQVRSQSPLIQWDILYKNNLKLGPSSENKKLFSESGALSELLFFSSNYDQLLRQFNLLNLLPKAPLEKNSPWVTLSRLRGRITHQIKNPSSENLAAFWIDQDQEKLSQIRFNNSCQVQYGLDTLTSGYPKEKLFKIKDLEILSKTKNLVEIKKHDPAFFDLNQFKNKQNSTDLNLNSSDDFIQISSFYELCR